jgi:hypothetical protein
MQPVTPEFSRPNGVMTNSRLGASMGKDMKRERSQPAAALNYVALNKDEMDGLASTLLSYIWIPCLCELQKFLQ